MISKISKKINSFKAHNPESKNLEILTSMLGLGWRIFTAKIYLRKCTSIGQFVSTNNKPLIKNKGQLILGNEVRIWSNIQQTKLFTGKNGYLKIGDNSRINGAHITSQKSITIGNNCRISPYVLIMDSNFHSSKNHFTNVKGKSIVIEDDVWVASKATILEGVHIGKGAVVAAGAVVTKNVPEFSLVAGVPAKVLKVLNRNS